LSPTIVLKLSGIKNGDESSELQAVDNADFSSDKLKDVERILKMKYNQIVMINICDDCSTIYSNENIKLCQLDATA